jgi:acyl carrier protein
MTISGKIKSFLKNTFLIDGDIKEDDSFLENGYIDSTGFLELIDYIISEFNLRIEDQDVSPANFDTIRGIEKFILSKQNN